MAKGTPEQAAERYARRTAAASQDWVAGVDTVTESPGAKAAAKAQTWQMKVSSPAAVEKYKRRVGSVSTEDWKAATKAAQGRYAAGAQAAQAKMARYQAAVAPHIAEGKRRLSAMPSLTIEDSKARQNFWTDWMASFKYSG